MLDADLLTLSALRESYRAGNRTPLEVITRLLDRADGAAEHSVWITRCSRAQVLAYVQALDPRRVNELPLYGVPFVIKDNIDLAGIATTAGCPAFAYVPSQSATVVQKLIDAGAIPLGKSNLDQFATGLVGTRSPYGACRNSINPEFISGGSSSGSAVAVASGLASFSLGTDTAGSGRVPAAFNNIVGLKPSNGRLSTRGVVPACRSLDCVSIFALTTEDAAEVLSVAQGFDSADPFSQASHDRHLSGTRIGVPRASQLRFFGDLEYERLFGQAVARAAMLGGTLVEIDFEPFLEAARLLYEGPWLAERYAAVGGFLEAQPAAMNPVTRGIIEAGKTPSAVAAFRASYQLKEFRRRSETAWSEVDAILTPTAGTIYRLDAVLADPLTLNSNLGYYTNFLNLFDLCGVAVPGGFRTDGLPFGITLIGPRDSDRALLNLAGQLHRAAVKTLGAMSQELSPTPPKPSRHSRTEAVGDADLRLAVCGAHMHGLPLNHQLRERGGRFVSAAATSPTYRLVVLPGGPPERPGLVRCKEGGGSIALEIWTLPATQVGGFLAGIPAPLGLGRVELSSGDWVTGFLCENYAAADAQDITRCGGWRHYLAEIGRP